MADKPKRVEIETWFVTGGGGMLNTAYLDADHPKHPYNQIKSKGLRPEDYGVEHPHVLEFKDKSKEELIEEILDLRKEVEAYIKGGF